MNACRKATSSSSAIMNSVSGMAVRAPVIVPEMLVPAPPKMKISPTKHRTTMWPAVMLAKRRNSRVKGFRKMPRISTGVRMNIFNTGGIPGIQSVCSQKCLLLLSMVSRKVSTASTMVTEILPVRFALPGKKGIWPIRLRPRIKKNADNRYGMYFSYLGPMEGLATSSRMKM